MGTQSLARNLRCMLASVAYKEKNAFFIGYFVIDNHKSQFLELLISVRFFNVTEKSSDKIFEK